MGGAVYCPHRRGGVPHRDLCHGGAADQIIYVTGGCIDHVDLSQVVVAGIDGVGGGVDVGLTFGVRHAWRLGTATRRVDGVAIPDAYR